MSEPTGISQNVQQRIISGARVAFDPRSTAKAHATRDYTNRKSRKAVKHGDEP